MASRWEGKNWPLKKKPSGSFVVRCQCATAAQGVGRGGSYAHQPPRCRTQGPAPSPGPAPSRGFQATLWSGQLETMSSVPEFHSRRRRWDSHSAQSDVSAASADPHPTAGRRTTPAAPARLRRPKWLGGWAAALSTASAAALPSALPGPGAAVAWGEPHSKRPGQSGLRKPDDGGVFSKRSELNSGSPRWYPDVRKFHLTTSDGLSAK